MNVVVFQFQPFAFQNVRKSEIFLHPTSELLFHPLHAPMASGPKIKVGWQLMMICGTWLRCILLSKAADLRAL